MLGISSAKLTPLCVESARALRVSFCFRFVIDSHNVNYTFDRELFPHMATVVLGSVSQVLRTFHLPKSFACIDLFFRV